MRPIDAEPSEGRIKLHGAIRGDGAYEGFKRIASEFYTNHTYKFVALTLDEEPRPDVAIFTAEFWRAQNGTKSSPSNDPLTLEELREMDGEPVWVDDVVFRRDRSCGGLWAIVVLACNEIIFGDKDSMPLKDVVGFAYHRKPEEGTT